MVSFSHPGARNVTYSTRRLGPLVGHYDLFRERSLLAMALVRYLTSRSIIVALPRSTWTNERASASPVKD